MALIFEIVINMSFRKELEGLNTLNECKEFQIVQDADRLDAIGAIGLARCFAYSGATGRPIIADSVADFSQYTAIQDKLLSAQSYNDATLNNTGDAIEHIYEKLLKLKSLMKTASGKRLAEQRHSFMVAFLQQLSQEFSFSLQ